MRHTIDLPTSAPRRTGRLRSPGAVSLAAVLALCGCAGDGGTGDLDEMVFLSYLPLETLSLAPEMLAYAGGYFEEEGLEVTLEPVNGSPVAIQSLIGGSGHVTRAGGIDVLSVSSEGHTLVNIGTLERGGGFRIVSAESDAIESIDDLPGTTIGVGSEGGTSTKTLDLALEAAGYSAEDVARQAVPVTAATFALVEQGRIDGYMLGIDTAVLVTAQNEDAISSPAGLTAPPDVQSYVTTPEQIENNPDQIERFMRAIAKATQFIIEDEDLSETLDIIRTEFSFDALDNDEVAVEALDLYRQVWVGDGSHGILEQDHDRWQEAYDVMVDAELATAGGDPESWITDEFVPLP
ncbi:ABC transporter substrate-binding protein [Pseudoclavibacter endophyticus]|nr:ABC transporter substrate-binding protein [Pseudoclavibacter endophyticus]